MAKTSSSRRAARRLSLSPQRSRSLRWAPRFPGCRRGMDRDDVHRQSHRGGVPEKAHGTEPVFVDTEHPWVSLSMDQSTSIGPATGISGNGWKLRSFRREAIAPKGPVALVV